MAADPGSPPAGSPLARFLDDRGFLLLDGGLATTLESHGADLGNELWSASLLAERPELLSRVHREFLEAGSDCIATASYQASFEGFRRRGADERAAISLLERSSRLAVAARDAFWGRRENRQGRLKPLVAASVGPYGAFLADGSEYTGDYGVGRSRLREFHERRWRLLAQTSVDLMACETFPSLLEALVVAELLEETPERWAWFSFTCRDRRHLSDGTPIREAGLALESCTRIAALAVNCVSPADVPALIAELRAATTKPILVYPNRGEGWDAVAKRWIGEGALTDWGEAAVEWLRLGASGIGGCCRVGPDAVARMRGALEVHGSKPSARTPARGSRTEPR